MVIGYVTGTLRGMIAWLVGYLVVLLLLILGLVNGTGFLRTAADIYMGAHAIPGITGSFEWIVLIPVAIIGIVGVRLGRSVGRGLLGYAKALIAGRGDSRTYRLKKAGKRMAIFAIGYLLATLITATLVGIGVQDVLVDTALMILVVGTPAAGFGVIIAE